MAEDKISCADQSDKNQKSLLLFDRGMGGGYLPINVFLGMLGWASVRHLITSGGVGYFDLLVDYAVLLFVAILFLTCWRWFAVSLIAVDSSGISVNGPFRSEETRVHWNDIKECRITDTPGQRRLKVLKHDSAVLSWVLPASIAKRKMEPVLGYLKTHSCASPRDERSNLHLKRTPTAYAMRLSILSFVCSLGLLMSCGIVPIAGPWLYLAVVFFATASLLTEYLVFIHRRTEAVAINQDGVWERGPLFGNRCCCRHWDDLSAIERTFLDERRGEKFTLSFASGQKRVVIPFEYSNSDELRAFLNEKSGPEFRNTPSAKDEVQQQRSQGNHKG
jgi:hypothetical protein